MEQLSPTPKTKMVRLPKKSHRKYTNFMQIYNYFVPNLKSRPRPHEIEVRL